ncbi:MAG: hypothetical protein F6K26_18970 [Moorea sp. SIO2I5]|nr:hypothetical protein [Moorena sp. SIO2I5]
MTKTEGVGKLKSINHLYSVSHSNQIHQIFSRFPIPDSRFSILDSLLPIPYSLLPTPYSLFPIPFTQ